VNGRRRVEDQRQEEENVMDIALMSASMLDRPWEAVLDAASQHGICLLEACAGGHIPKHHYDPIHLASDDKALDRFAEALNERGMRICAFSCHGNPLHPSREIAGRCHEDFVATCEIAAKLGVNYISLLAGCPGGGPDDNVPNWIINLHRAPFRRRGVQLQDLLASAGSDR
jgi:sugar phosphate isomerase/epimerase